MGIFSDALSCGCVVSVSTLGGPRECAPFLSRRCGAHAIATHRRPCGCTLEISPPIGGGEDVAFERGEHATAYCDAHAPLFRLACGCTVERALACAADGVYAPFAACCASHRAVQPYVRGVLYVRSTASHDFARGLTLARMGAWAADADGAAAPVAQDERRLLKDGERGVVLEHEPLDEEHDALILVGGYFCVHDGIRVTPTYAS